MPTPDATGNQTTGESTRYDALCERAIAFLERQGGQVHEDALVAFVFGKSASPVLWRPLLHTALDGDETLEYLADGRWRLRGSQDGQPEVGESLLPEFVAIDVETTGLKPSTQRITEVALIRYRDGEEVGRFNRLFNPGRPIPAYITKLTGIRDDDVAEEAKFADLAGEIVEFIGGELLVGHNVGFDVSFLNAELQRARYAKLINETLDTLVLAGRVMPGLRRPGLERVARAVGLSPRKVHRAAADAELTAQVALRLQAEAQRGGIGSLGALKALAAPREKRPRKPIGRGLATMDRALLEGIPRKPGVYLMRDHDGRVIYVGKANNLRERVGSYFSQPLGYARKMDGLLESISRIDTEVVGSELEALLLEAQLIRRYAPRYNTMMRSFEHYPYIRVDVGNRWPRITLVRDRKADGARYFGPYRSRNAARKTVDCINDILPLRTCTRSFKDARSYGNPCLRLAIGKCLGPCVDVTTAAQYREMVDTMVRFLDGEDDALYEVLWGGLEKAANAQDFERAEKLRRNLATVNGIVAGQRQLREAVERNHLVVVVPGREAATRDLWLVLEGRIWSRMTVALPGASDDALIASVPKVSMEIEDSVISVEAARRVGDSESVGEPDVGARLRRAYSRYRRHGIAPVGQESLDDTHILNRWIAGNDGHPAIIVLDRDAVDETGYWRTIVARATALAEGDLKMRADRVPDTSDEALHGVGLDTSVG